MHKPLPINLKLILIFAATVIFTVSCSLPRVVEKSDKDRPDWVYGISHGFIIVEGVGYTWEDAQNDALKKLKERIVSSVAVNVSSETNTEISETVINNMSGYRENTDVKTNISTDFFNSLKGINLSKSQAFYWEKKLYPGKVKKVHYHIMYPFTDAELNVLIAEWERTDKEFTLELDNLENDVNNCTNIDDLDMLYNKAESLEKIFSGARKTRVSIIKTNISSLRENLKFEVQSHERGRLVIKLLSSDRYFRMNSIVDFSSDCAVLQDQKIIDDGETLEINYDADFCYSKENADFKITQTYSGTDIKSRYTIPDGANTVRLTVNEPIRFKRSPENQADIRWYIPIRIFTENSFTVTKVELVVSHQSTIDLRKIIGGDDKESYFITDINKQFTSKGDFSLQVDVPSNSGGRQTLVGLLFDIFVAETSTYSAGGKIYVKPVGEDREYVFKFENKTIIRGE